MTIAFVTGAAAGGGSGGSCTATPASQVTGNTLVAVIAANTASGTVNTPAGWTLVAKSTSGTAGQIGVFTAPANTGVTTTFTASSFCQAVCLQYSGTGGIDGTPTFNSGGGTTFTAPTITPGVANDLWIACFGDTNGATISTPPTGFTARNSAASPGNDSIYSYEKQLVGSGATGTATATPSGGASFQAVSFLLKPAANTVVETLAASGSATVAITPNISKPESLAVAGVATVSIGAQRLHDYGRALLSAPTYPHDATTKAYVDAQDAAAITAATYFLGNVEAGSGFTQTDYRYIYDFTDTGAGITAYFPVPIAGGGWVVIKNNPSSVQAGTVYCNNGEELDDGSNSVTLQPGDGILAFNDGGNWIVFKTSSTVFAATLTFLAETADFDANGSHDYLVTPASGDVVATLQPPTKAGMMLFKLSPSATHKLTVRAHTGYSLDNVANGQSVLANPGDAIWVIGRDDFNGWISLRAPSFDPTTGNLIAPTQSPGDNSLNVATTAYVDAGDATIDGHITTIDLSIAALTSALAGRTTVLTEVYTSSGSASTAAANTLQRLDTGNYTLTLPATPALGDRVVVVVGISATGTITVNSGSHSMFPLSTANIALSVPGSVLECVWTGALWEVQLSPSVDAVGALHVQTPTISTQAVNKGYADTKRPAFNVVTKTADYTAVDGDIVLVNAASANIAITVPKAINNTVTVKRIDSSTHTVTITCDGATPGTIDGDAHATLVGIEAAGTFVGDGTNIQITSVNGALYASATSAPTASTLALRDGAGRSQFADPSAAQDAATKNYVDAFRLGAFVNAFVASMAPGTSYLADASGGSFNMNLPGSPVAGQRWIAAKYDQSVNPIGVVFPFGSTCYYLGSLVTSLTIGLSFLGDSVDITYDGTHYIAIPSSAAQPYQAWTPTLTQNGSTVTKTVNFARWNRIAGRIHAYCQLTATAAGAIGLIAVGMPVQPLNNAQPLNGQFWWLHGNHYSGFPSVFGSLGSYTVIGIGSQPSSPTSTAMGAGLPAAAISIGDTIGYSIVYEG